MTSERLNVIALISGGKDSFFSLLHCIRHGHGVVALANLYPATSSQDKLIVIQPDAPLPPNQAGNDAKTDDLHSFMYQTVGHEVVPLYAAATGLPLYRQPIHGSAVHYERDYERREGDEVESMYTLLAAIKERHPEVNAVSAGAILSTYQRTRVESVALRLGLTPLAFLWKYPVLPPLSGSPRDDAQLLLDMAAAGLEARIIKVASAGLTENNLWECVSNAEGAEKVKRALRKFGAAGGAVLGEGGEFETIVLDGPKELFRKRIIIPPRNAREVVNEGGGAAWLRLRDARVEDKSSGEEAVTPIRTPEQWDASFTTILDDIFNQADSVETLEESTMTSATATILGSSPTWCDGISNRLHWSVMVDDGFDAQTIEEETIHVVAKIRSLLDENFLEPSQISNSLIILRQMCDFPTINREYAKLFTKPNPPSRVTISCGDLLPERCNICIFLMVDSVPQASTDRLGLHVQSRSYWAPANIGPYSQAIGIPMLAQTKASKAVSWSVAGQIPLIPSTMTLPPPSSVSQATQITLSLQHLWRIGADLKIQYWTSVVAYFARATHSGEMEQNAKMAGRAWHLAHTPPEEDEDIEGPDLWDLKYNPAFMSLAGDEQRESKTSLPDWAILTLREQSEPRTCIPPFFAVEVQELPRQSAVEWHAHSGVSGLAESSVELMYFEASTPGWKTWHFVAKESCHAMVHTVVAKVKGDNVGQADLQGDMASVYQKSLFALRINPPQEAVHVPHLQYLVTGEGHGLGPHHRQSHAIIPCYSVWSFTGERYLTVGLYRTEVKS